MAVSFNKVAKRVFSLVVGRGRRVSLFDQEGKKVYDPEAARRFFVDPEKIMITLAEAEDRSGIRVYFSEGTNVTSIKRLLSDLRKTATHFLLSFTARKFARSLSPKDFAYQAEIEKGIAEGSKMKTSLEERMEGSSRTSYQDFGNTRLIIRHKSKVDENVIGARARNIKTIFIETHEGERFKMPTTNLLAARAMARHISKGGSFSDDTGSVIHEMVDEWRGLSTLDRHVRENRKNIDNDLHHDVRVTIAGRVDEISDTFRKLTKKRSYHSVVPQLLGEAPEDDNEIQSEMERLKENLMLEGEDHDLALRSVARLNLRHRQPLEEAPVSQVDTPAPREEKHQKSLDTALEKLFHDKGTNRLDFDPKTVRFGDGGHLDHDAPEEFTDFHAEVTAKLGALAPAVRDDALSIYLSEIHDKLTDRKKLTPEEKKTVGYALSVAGLTDRRLRLSTLDKKKAESIEHEEITALTEWAEGFDPDAILKEVHQPSIHRGKTDKYKSGEIAAVMPTPEISRGAYPHANWLGEHIKVKLLGDAIKGSSDLVEVELHDGTRRSLYGFNLNDHASHNSQLGEDNLWALAMDVVRWRGHKEKIQELTETLSEDDVAAVLEKIDMIWEPTVGDSIRDVIFEAALTPGNVDQNAEEIASELDSEESSSEETVFEMPNVGDLMSAEEALQESGLVFNIDYDDLTLSFDDPKDAEEADLVLKQNGIPHLTEDTAITLGGNEADDLVRDVSPFQRHRFNDRTPTVRSDSYLRVDEMSVREAMRLLDEENIDYTSYAPNRFDFYDHNSLDRARSILETAAIPVEVINGNDNIIEENDPTVVMAHLRDKIISLA